MSSSTRLPGSSEKQTILLVTGLAGGGKSTALQVLEDLGWETIDNFPVRLLKGLLANPDDQNGSHQGPLAIGFDSRTRGFVPDDVITLVKELTQLPQFQLSTMFIDCSSGELERRYNETRRRHPMAHGRPLTDGIRAERELLEPMRRWADMVIDTSEFASNQLQQHIRELFGESVDKPMTVTVSSFGFARGMPPLADLVFDMRFLDNPHWVEDLREQTGLDAPVGNHIRKDSGFAPAFERIRDLILDLLPRYATQGKSYVHIAFGCTGGRHRSVFTADQMGTLLREEGFSPTVRHRNLSSRATDAIEQMKR
ncbi:MAG: RNase adapter RapZ [Marinomonas sp.]